MTVEIPDVDLDVKDRDRTASFFREAVVASQVVEKRLAKHNTGVYFQKIPQDPINDLAAFPYKEAEELGYFKVDLIPNHVYDLVGSEEELLELLDAPVDWSWFQDERFFLGPDHRYRLTHLGKPRYFRLCQIFPPKSVLDVAALIAVIRPQKAHLINECKTLAEIRERVWEREEGADGYFFKKSHSVAFAMLVVLHAQIIARKLKRKTYEGEEDGGFFI